MSSILKRLASEEKNTLFTSQKSSYHDFIDKFREPFEIRTSKHLVALKNNTHLTRAPPKG